jgi:hypothetical protein
MKIDGLWFRHYKGKEYQVVCEAEDSNDLHWRVIYRDRHGRTFDRSRENFMGTVDNQSISHGDRRFEPMVSGDAEVIHTCELRRTEAVIVMQVYDGVLEVIEDDGKVVQGKLVPRDPVPLQLFNLKIVNARVGIIPEGFFNGKFDLRYSDENDHIVQLSGCEAENTKTPFYISGTYESVNYT